MVTLKKAVTILKRGGLVVYPTESFWALGADATNARAVGKVFNIKGRGRRKPIALIAGNQRQVKKYFFMTKAEQGMAHKHWPGALTLLLKPKAPTPSNSPSGRGRGIAADALLGTTPSGHSTGHPSLKRRGRIGIGVRVPAHALARRLALAAGVPITATSANVSGRNPVKLRTVVQRLFPALSMLSGRCGKYRKPSTVVAVEHGKPVVLRHGQVKM